MQRRHVTCLLLAMLISTSLVGCDFGYYITYKSFSDALRECSDYYEVSSCTLAKYVEDLYPCEELAVRRLVHCAMLNLGAWSDVTKAKDHVLGNFFQPAPGDTCYVYRTQQCVQNIRNDTAVFDQAYETFQCYFRQYGNLKETQQFIPNTLFEQVQLGMFVVGYSDIPQEVFEQWRSGNVVDDPSYKAILYVWAVLCGFYVPRVGISLENLYTQYAVPELLTPQTQQCVQRVLDGLCDDARESEKMFQVYKTCLLSLQAVISAQTVIVGTGLADGVPSSGDDLQALSPLIPLNML